MAFYINIETCEDCPLAYDEKCHHPEPAKEISFEEIPQDCPIYFKAQADEVRIAGLLYHSLVCRMPHRSDKELEACASKYIVDVEKFFEGSEAIQKTLEEFGKLTALIQDLAQIVKSHRDFEIHKLLQKAIVHSEPSSSKKEEDDD